MMFELRHVFANLWWGHQPISTLALLMLIIIVPYRFAHLLLAFLIISFAIFMVLFPLSYHPNVFEMAASAAITATFIGLMAATAIKLVVRLRFRNDTNTSNDRLVLLTYAICIGPILSYLVLRIMAAVLSGSGFILAHALAISVLIISVLTWPRLSRRFSIAFSNFFAPTFVVTAVVLGTGICMSAMFPFYVRWQAELIAGNKPYALSAPGKFELAVATTSLSEWSLLTRRRSQFLFHGFLLVGDPVFCTSHNWSYVNARFENPRVVPESSCSSALAHFASSIPFLPKS